VPATVQAVLAARIDRLSSEAKHLLQTAAVIGLEVPLPLLETIAQLPTHTLYRSLAHLQTAEFLYETQLFPERVYTFKHALTYEVAYGGLLQERRRTLHTQIMNAIETLYADRVAEQVDQLAHHALRGEVWEKAFSYCRQAGAKAALRSAHRGAVAYWEQALVALQHLPATHDALAQAIDVRFDLRNALWPLGEHKQIFEYLSQAEALAETLADQRRLGILSSFMTQHFRLIGDPARAIASGQRALAIATTLGDFPLQVETNFRLGRTYDSFGDYQQAAVFFRRNVVALEGDLLFEHFDLPGSLAVLSRAWLALCLAELGEFSEGITRGEEAVRMAQAIDHPYSLVSAYCGIGGLYLCKGDLSRAISALERSLGLCQTWDFPVLFPITATHLGYAYALSGRYTDALTLLEQAVTQAAATEPLSYYVLFLVRLGETYLMAGQAAKARECTERALVTSHSSKVRGGPQAWALRLRGELAVQHEFAESHKAETSYRQALALAEELGMRPLMAHCHLGLGLLYNRRGDRAQAQAEWSMATAQLQALEMPFWISRTMLPVQML
jgi:tetratricopeptide (TPR) repeat protein